MKIATPTLFAALAATIGVSVAVGAATPASAEVQYPWCAQYRKPLDANYQQCRETVSGIGGFCYRNPAYPPRERARRR